MGDPFRDGVLELIPQLRAYAATLARSRPEAEDLVQDTLMRAWLYRQSFQPGTQLKAWLYKILRNQFYTASTKSRWLVEDVDGRFANAIAAAPDQAWRVEFGELLDGLSELSADTRDAVLLVLAAGLTYEEAASVCDCHVGTMKSRVNRGRLALAERLDPRPKPRRPARDLDQPLSISA
jgi:RNA polymerase sigma-70 factor (ECF subfamily)